MDTWFPTFRRLLRIRVPYPAIWLRRTSWAQQQSLLRLLVVAIEENLPLVPLIKAWAADESGGQRLRLDRLAKLLTDGIALPDAVDEIPGVLGDEDVLAIRFGSQSGTLVASLRERLGEPGPTSLGLAPRLRKPMLYVLTLLLVGFFIVTFLQIKIVPELEKIVFEFDAPASDWLWWTHVFARFTIDYWYLFAMAIIAACWLTFSSWPGRRLRRALLGRFFRPLRALYTADILEKLGVAIEAGRPVAGALSTLARYHFDPTLRHQLLYIRNEMEQGTDVWRSMGAIGLLSPPEERVLETAGRIGNRPWALRQIALVKKRQTSRLLARLTEWALPVVILLLGGFVLLQALGVFGPMVQILYSLI